MLAQALIDAQQYLHRRAMLEACARAVGMGVMILTAAAMLVFVVALMSIPLVAYAIQSW